MHVLVGLMGVGAPASVPLMPYVLGRHQMTSLVVGSLPQLTDVMLLVAQGKVRTHWLGYFLTSLSHLNHTSIVECNHKTTSQHWKMKWPMMIHEKIIIEKNCFKRFEFRSSGTSMLLDSLTFDFFCRSSHRPFPIMPWRTSMTSWRIWKLERSKVARLWSCEWWEVSKATFSQL